MAKQHLVVVTLSVLVDLEAWQEEYGHTNEADALLEIRTDLAVIDHYLDAPKWQGLVEVKHAGVSTRSL